MDFAPFFPQTAQMMPLDDVISLRASMCDGLIPLPTGRRVLERNADPTLTCTDETLEDLCGDDNGDDNDSPTRWKRANQQTPLLDESSNDSAHSSMSTSSDGVAQAVEAVLDERSSSAKERAQLLFAEQRRALIWACETGREALALVLGELEPLVPNPKAKVFASRRLGGVVVKLEPLNNRLIPRPVDVHLCATRQDFIETRVTEHISLYGARYCPFFVECLHTAERRRVYCEDGALRCASNAYECNMLFLRATSCNSLDLSLQRANVNEGAALVGFASIVSQVLLAIAFMHQLGVEHNDLGVRNVAVDECDRARTLSLQLTPSTPRLCLRTNGVNVRLIDFAMASNPIWSSDKPEVARSCGSEQQRNLDAADEDANFRRAVETEFERSLDDGSFSSEDEAVARERLVPWADPRVLGNFGMRCLADFYMQCDNEANVHVHKRPDSRLMASGKAQHSIFNSALGAFERDALLFLNELEWRFRVGRRWHSALRRMTSAIFEFDTRNSYDAQARYVHECIERIMPEELALHRAHLFQDDVAAGVEPSETFACGGGDDDAAMCDMREQLARRLAQPLPETSADGVPPNEEQHY